MVTLTLEWQKCIETVCIVYYWCLWPIECGRLLLFFWLRSFSPGLHDYHRPITIKGLHTGNSMQHLSKMTINLTWIQIRQIIRPIRSDRRFTPLIMRTLFNVCQKNSNNGRENKIPIKSQHFTIIQMILFMETRHIWSLMRCLLG